MPVRRLLVPSAALALIAVLGAACGEPGRSSAPHGSAADTVPGVGVLPPGSLTPVVDRPTTLPSTTLPPELQVGARAAGNRVLVIGDSLMASTSRRYDNTMCEVLVPAGWRVAVEAETNRFVEFGREVLAVRPPVDWDVVVVHLGTNFNGNVSYYRSELNRLVDRLAGVQVVLLTVTEFTESRRVVNEIIREVAEARAEVVVVDWAATTAAAPHLLGADGIHLTTEGRLALATDVALALGEAPDGPLAPSCLPSVFIDDSGGSVDGSTTTTTIRRRPATTTTTKPATTNPATTNPTTPVTIATTIPAVTLPSTDPTTSG